MTIHFCQAIWAMICDAAFDDLGFWCWSLCMQGGMPEFPGTLATSQLALQRYGK